MKKFQLEIAWGLIFCLALIVWMLIERLVGLHSTHIGLHLYLTNIFAIIAIAIYVFALRARRKANGGNLTYQQGFVSGLIITLVVTVLSPVLQWLVHTLISPNFFNNMIEYAVSSGEATRAEAEAYLNLSSYIVQSAIGAFVMGLITTAIVAFFVRTKQKSNVG